MNKILDDAVVELKPLVGICAACEITGRAKASHYRAKKPARCGPRRPQPATAWTYDPVEVDRIMAVLCDDEFVDLAPRQIYGRLLDRGEYLCSVSTMYRILARQSMSLERRNQRDPVRRLPPRLVATAPNQVWTWDITRMKGPKGQSAFHAYVVLDIYSRMVIGWVVARREDAEIAKALIDRCLKAQGISERQLIIHADRGAAMTSKSVAELLVELGVGKSHSRPRTSNDNPYSEAQFKTVKYHHTYPGRFDSIQHARTWLNGFIEFYNHQHLHTGIGLMAPATIHHGHAETVIAKRQAVLDDAYQANPHRFRQPPRAPRHRPKVWINKPPQPQESTTN